MFRLTGLFEIEGRSRLGAMEGLRGVAVFLVFLQHYSYQGQLFGVTGVTALFARADLGNRGVELFFVLSGFLIYGILLRKRPHFSTFMARRAQRIFPAFLAVLVLAILLDFRRPEHRIPEAFGPALLYIAANLTLLPGLLPIEPLFVVNWTLSYEWWFYTLCAALFSWLHLGSLPQRLRVGGILSVAALLVLLEASGLPHVPIRGLCLFSGMLLVEMRVAGLRPVGPGWAGVAVLAAFAVCVAVPLQEWICALALALAFFALCSATLHSHNWLSRALSVRPLRWLGNISYSFYLLHGLVMVPAARTVFRLSSGRMDIAFWGAMPVIFLLALAASALLFLTVEKPLSLGRVPGETAASARTTT